MSMSDHHKPVSRFVSDARDRKSELEERIKTVKADLVKMEQEFNLMRDIVNNGESFLNLTNATAGGESAIVGSDQLAKKR